MSARILLTASQTNTAQKGRDNREGEKAGGYDRNIEQKGRHENTFQEEQGKMADTRIVIRIHSSLQ
ncbi:hypothetical protein CXU03_12555 [Akkermansia muciniphila]|nr:hypothetical protein CXU03_12555 [Akkermansia muciniphila]DAE69628.1 MAG TPA: hypothetical protein [Caudoviricetes sp.]